MEAVKSAEHDSETETTHGRMSELPELPATFLCVCPSWANHVSLLSDRLHDAEIGALWGPRHLLLVFASLFWSSSDQNCVSCHPQPVCDSERKADASTAGSSIKSQQSG